MNSPKLFLFKAANANTVVILRLSATLVEWKMFVWNLDTDELTPGPTHYSTTMRPEHSRISPDGKYFIYAFNKIIYAPPKILRTKEAVLCQLPSFEPLYVDHDVRGDWSKIKFDKDGCIMYALHSLIPQQLEKVGSVDLEFSKEQHGEVAPSGLIEEEIWVDPKGRKVRTMDEKLFIDDSVMFVVR